MQVGDANLDGNKTGVSPDFFKRNADVSKSVGSIWQLGLAVARWSRSTSYSTPGPVNTGMHGWLSVGRYTISVCNQPPRSTQPPG